MGTSLENSLENRFKYQSKEYQDDLGLNLYDFLLETVRSMGRAYNYN